MALLFFLVRLRKWWEELFPDSDRSALLMNTRPMLIGIMHHTSHSPGGFSPFEYHPRLLKCDRVWNTEARLRFEDILEMFRAFQQEWQRNQRFLVPFDFGRTTGLCSDVLVEITKYLSLVDAIDGFSISILPLLQQTHSKVYLNDPSRRFLEMIPQYVDPKQIASIRVTDRLMKSERYFSTLQKFDQLISLTAITMLPTIRLSSLLAHLPNVQRLSLWCEGSTRWFIGRHLKNLQFHSVTNLHIHGADSDENQYWGCGVKDEDSKNTSITSLTFDTEYYPPYRARTVSQRNRREVYWSLLTFTLKFIESLVNVQRVRLFASRLRVEPHLTVRSWQDLIKKCVRLDRVVIQLVDDGDLTDEANNIEQELRAIRPEMIFRIKSA